MYNRLLSITIKWLWLLILIPILASVVAFVYSNQQPTVYRAVTRLIIGPGINSPNPDLDSLRAGALLMQTYSELIETENFRRQVIEDTNVDLSTLELRELINVRPITDTQILNVIVEYSDPDTAIAIANEVASEMVELSPSTEYNQFLLNRIQAQADRIEDDITSIESRLEELYSELELESDPSREAVLIQRISDEETSLSDANGTLADLFETLQSPFTNQVEIVDLAEFAQEINPSLPLTLLLVFSAGCVISLAILILLMFIDSLYINTATAKRKHDYPPLWGTVRFNKKSQTSDMRMLSAVLMKQMKNENIKSVIVTGIGNGKDVASIASDIATNISKTGTKVLLVDADFTNTVIADNFSIPSSVSLINTLKKGKAEAVKPHDDYPNLYVLPSGETSADAFFLIASERFTNILEEFGQKVDHVIVITPSLSSFEGSAGMVAWANNAVLIVEEGKTRLSNIENALAYLGSVDSKILGMIMTKK